MLRLEFVWTATFYEWWSWGLQTRRAYARDRFFFAVEFMNKIIIINYYNKITSMLATQFITAQPLPPDPVISPRLWCPPNSKASLPATMNAADRTAERGSIISELAYDHLELNWVSRKETVGF